MAKRDLILHNLWWKLISLFLAIIVWFVVRRSDSSDNQMPQLMVTRRFPHHELAVMRDVSDKRSIRVIPSEVDITVRVPAEDLSFKESDIQTFVDFTEVRDLSRPVRIRVFLPPEVRLQSIQPDQASIEIVQ